MAQPDQLQPDGPLRAIPLHGRPQPAVPHHNQQPVIPQLDQHQPAVAGQHVPQLGQHQPAVVGQQQPSIPQPPTCLQQPGAPQHDLQNGATHQSIMQVIYSIHDDMRRYINISSLYPYLNKYGILLREERQVMIIPYLIQTQKVDKLLEFMDGKSPSCQRDFLKAIKDAREHAGHEEICNLLRKKGLHI